MSKNKTRPLNLLIVDDDKDYVESLNRDAQGYRIILKHVCNLEEGKKFRLVLDVGTTGIKAFVFDEKFRPVAKVYQKLKKRFPQFRKLLKKTAG